jgi:hypothetical protein
MGNHYSNTIIHNGLTNIYNKNKNTIYSWRELKGETINKAVLFFIGKGYKIVIHDKKQNETSFNCLFHKKIKYNRVILINKNGIVDNYPIIG